jgi:hypothetical protein
VGAPPSHRAADPLATAALFLAAREFELPLRPSTVTFTSEP